MVKDQEPQGEVEEEKQVEEQGELIEDDTSDVVSDQEKSVTEQKEEVDVNALKAELSSEYERRLQEKIEEVNKQTVERLSRAFGISDDTAGDEKPLYGEGDDMNEYLDKLSEWREREKQRHEEELESQKQEELQVQRQNFQTATIQGWSGQLAEMQEQGILPEVKDPNDANDLGVKARVDAINGLSEYNEKRKLSGKPETYNLWEAYYNHTSKRVESGSDAPVFGSSGASAGAGESEYSYEDIRNARSPQDLI